jgi:iron complex outermembrane receptor protein
MSELKNERNIHLRRRLLTSASAFVLVATVAMRGAKAADTDEDRPQFWIELGGQLSRLDDSQERFSPAIMADRPSVFAPSGPVEKPPLSSIDESAKVSFQPEDSNWIVSASILFGRSSSYHRLHQQQPHPPTRYIPIISRSGALSEHKFASKISPFADTSSQIGETHLIVDFQAGKDVGVGMFGGGSSVLSFGVRFAQFTSRSNSTLRSEPGAHVTSKYFPYYFYRKTPNGGPAKIPYGYSFKSNIANISAIRSFRGFGPSLSWNSSVPVAGRAETGKVAFDWGANAAVLFGRQKLTAHIHTTVNHNQRNFAFNSEYLHRTSTYTDGSPKPRIRTVTVPNVGGFAGLSFQVQNFKVSAGYRADFFFGAMDGGIDTHKSENVGFYGPFASVSVGLGG